jgi:ferrochelatase
MTINQVAETDNNTQNKENKKKSGVLLVNLGTPAAPSAPEIGRYLAQFLSDRRVVNLPRWLWWPILYGIILRLRPRKLVANYQSIWQQQGSPLLVYGQQQQALLAEELTSRCQVKLPVVLAMTYGSPSINQGLNQLAAEHISELVVLPLFPQYSSTTSAAVFDAIANYFKKQPVIPHLHFINSYADHPSYIAALANSVQNYWQQQGRGDRLLISLHGIPQKLAQQGDPYRQQCELTAGLLAERLGLGPDEWQLCYQSRFGWQPWLQPYTDKTLKKWGKTGINRVDVVCPGFAADCLETLEEISEENRQCFINAGGQDYHYIPALNDQIAHIKCLADIVTDKIKIA